MRGHEYISSKEVVNMYVLKQGTDSTNYFDEDLAKVLIDEAVDEITTATNLEICFDHITTTNPKTGKYKLKSNFVRPIQVAYRGVPTPDEYYTRTTVKEWVQKGLEGCCDTKVIIEKDCPKCVDLDACCCREKAWSVELDVKDYMLASNAEFAQNYSRFLIGSTNSNEVGHYYSNFHKGFQIIKPSLSYFHALPQNLKSCHIPYMSCPIEYKIDQKVLQVNSSDPCGEILISYLGRRFDDEGYMLVPNEVFVLKALEARLTAGIALQEYRKKPTQTTRAFWMDMLSYSDRLIAKAKSKLRTKDPDEFKAIVNNIVRRRIPQDRDSVSGANIADEYNPNRYLLG